MLIGEDILDTFFYGAYVEQEKENDAPKPQKENQKHLQIS